MRHGGRKGLLCLGKSGHASWRKGSGLSLREEEGRAFQIEGDPIKGIQVRQKVWGFTAIMG